ncbi:secondary carrier transporter [Lithospermum erythrorhizon]|uniref:Secondary carrier transporter n=1 Tax=Lithospermum erythrorhizon TaxID=34254 RepID=A0AAV3NRS7_LITER
MEAENKSSCMAVSNIGAWAMNVVSSVGIIMANKQLMSANGFAFSFATTLTGFHFTVTALVGMVSNAAVYRHPNMDELKSHAELSWILPNFQTEHDSSCMYNGMDPPQ